jgi:hypothetical protein
MTGCPLCSASLLIPLVVRVAGVRPADEGALDVELVPSHARHVLQLGQPDSADLECRLRRIRRGRCPLSAPPSPEPGHFASRKVPSDHACFCCFGHQTVDQVQQLPLQLAGLRTAAEHCSKLVAALAAMLPTEERVGSQYSSKPSGCVAHPLPDVC